MLPEDVISICCMEKFNHNNSYKPYFLVFFMSMHDLLYSQYLTKGIPDVLAFGAGVTKGFCDASGIPLASLLDNSLKFGPFALQTLLGMYSGMTTSIAEHDDNCMGRVVGTGAFEALIGAAETALGYCVGFTVAKLSRGN